MLVCKGKTRVESIQIIPKYKTEQAERPEHFRTVILFLKKEVRSTVSKLENTKKEHLYYK